MLALAECPSAMATGTATGITNPAVAAAHAEHHETSGCDAADETVALRSPTQQPLHQHVADSGAESVVLVDDRPHGPHPTDVAVRREALPPPGQTLLLLLSIQRN